MDGWTDAWMDGRVYAISCMHAVLHVISHALVHNCTTCNCAEPTRCLYCGKVSFQPYIYIYICIYIYIYIYMLAECLVGKADTKDDKPVSFLPNQN